MAKVSYDVVGDGLEVLKGPVGDLSRFRVYAMKVAMDTAVEAPIRWHRDGKSLHCQDITCEIDILAEKMSFCLEQERLISECDLCLGIPDLT